MLGMDGDDGMESSFQSFLRRPEHQPMIEALQRKQIRRGLRSQEIQNAKDFQAKVLKAHQQAQADIAPFLKSPALRTIIKSFTNDEDGDFAKWASNPQVLAMLRQAKELLDEGRMTEEEMMIAFQAQLAAPPKDGDAKPEVPKVMRLGIEELVPALNEHLSERRRGNECYRRGQMDQAIYHYERAKSIVDIVAGMGKAEQEEIDSNKVLVLLNIAAVQMERGEHAAACSSCSDALALDPKNVKGLVRRAHCHLARHEHKEAQADLDAVDELDSYNMKAAALLRKLSRTAVQGKGSEAAVFAKMFDKTLHVQEVTQKGMAM